MLRSILMIAAVCLFAALPVAADTCECSSAFCSTSISCGGGCYAICGVSCESGCNVGGADGRGGPFQQTPLTDGGPITLSTDSGSSLIGDEVSARLGYRFEFYTNDDVVVDIKNLPTEVIFEALAGQGVAVAVQDVEGEARTHSFASLRADNRMDDEISRALSFLTGDLVTFSRSGNDDLYIDLKNMPVWQVMKIMNDHGETKVIHSR